MDIQKRSTGFGAAIILFAVLLRLACTDLVSPAYARRMETANTTIRLPSAGLSAPKITQPPQTFPATAVPTTLPPQTTVPVAQQPVGITFTGEDTAYLRLRTATDCGYYPDIAMLLQQSLSWQLSGTEPTVLIYHSHACECYTKEPGQHYTELINCRTTAVEYNMVAVGDALAAQLEQAGIPVIHDRQLHDNPSYSSAYYNSRASVADYLAQYPSIRLVLDLHRDAATQADGSRYATAATVDGQPAAQLMFVVGTDYNGSYHPQWQDNLAIALKLQVILEQLSPGITRATTLRGSRFNQDMAAGALIIEVGASGNTLTEVYRTVPILAEAILALQNGANT